MQCGRVDIGLVLRAIHSRTHLSMSFCCEVVPTSSGKVNSSSALKFIVADVGILFLGFAIT